MTMLRHSHGQRHSHGHKVIAVLGVTMLLSGAAASAARAGDPDIEPTGESTPPSSEIHQSQPPDQTAQRNEPTLPPPENKPVLILLAPPAPQPRLPAYQLKWQYDVPFLVVIGLFGIGRAIRSNGSPAYCAVSGCDPSGLNPLDKRFAGQYDPKWTQSGDLVIYGIETASLATLLLDEGIKNGLNDVVVVAEATIASSVAAGIVSPLAGRPRPLVYGTTAPASVRENGTSGLSFFSGHTATVFGAAVSTFVTLHRLHPDRVWPYFILLGGVALGTFEGYSRVMAGSHFPTDVIAGAAAGTAIGILIPALHDSPRRLGLQPVMVSGGGGLAIVGRY